MDGLPVVVIGAGPQGLAAAAHLLEQGESPVVVESGAGPAAAVSEWGHVRLFSDWSELVDSSAARLLASRGWIRPSDGFPTGSEWVSRYLAPLALALGERVTYDTRVTGVSRDRSVDRGLEGQPFTVHLSDTDGNETTLRARAVLDASGTWSLPNPAGADGFRAHGESEASDRIRYRIPDFAEPSSFIGKHTVVVGSGHSATTAVIQLARLARTHPRTRVTWVLRKSAIGTTFGSGDADTLPARAALGVRARAAVDSGLVELVTGFRISSFTRTGHGTVIGAEDGRELPAADSVVVLTGFQPDLSFLTGIRLELDPDLLAPLRVASHIDPTIHTCGSVQATGAPELSHPEPGFYILGSKSYGRAPTFLASTGYEQVRSVVAALGSDVATAAPAELAGAPMPSGE